MKNGFDGLAPFYDQLAHFVFGNILKDAQCEFLHLIGENDKVLILGGGTGWILNEIFTQKPNVKITFVDLSGKMIAKARNTLRNEHSKHVRFIQGEYTKAIHTSYDVVFTAFYLDMFKQNEVHEIVNVTNCKLNDNGSWMFIDFRNSNRYVHRLLLKIMYLFFKATCSIDANKLANFEEIFTKNRLKRVGEKRFFNGMVESIIYRK